MKTIKAIFIFVIIFSNTLLVGQVKKILFLGNSYTAVNSLPDKISDLALSLGDSVYFDSNTPGGFRLMNHATNTTTLAKISDRDWDFVVIQAQSQEPSLHPAELATEVLPFAVILNDSIKSNFACTETVFYLTWGRKYGDQQNCEAWPPVCTFLGMQERLVAGYMTMAEQNGSTIAPVGLVWKQAMDNDSDSLINLYSTDNSHPSLAGTYLTACVMYATMFQKSPLGSRYFAGLLESEAVFLQQMAEDVVLSETYNFTFFDPYTNINYNLGWESWFDYGNIAFAGFSYSAIENTYSFFDNALNAETFLWDFGDNETSYLQNPTHSYTESGNFIVSQSIENACYNDFAFDTLNIVISSSEDINRQLIVALYPNPGNGIYQLTINSSEKHDHLFYQIVDVNGKLVDESRVCGGENISTFQLDLSALRPGHYILKIFLDEKVIHKTLIIQ